jgi:RNA polymerase sigma-70 factor, ECF subfamily
MNTTLTSADSATDLDLLRAYRQAGDSASFERLCRRHYKSAFQAALAITRNQADADDAVQAAFIKVMKSCEAFSLDRGSFLSWLITIVANTARTMHRSKQRRTWHESSSANPIISDGSTEEPIQQTMMEVVADACALLEERYRLPLQLHYREGKPISEVATILQLPENTVRSQLRRAQERLRSILAARGYASPEITGVS